MLVCRHLIHILTVGNYFIASRESRGVTITTTGQCHLNTADIFVEVAPSPPVVSLRAINQESLWFRSDYRMHTCKYQRILPVRGH